MKQTPISVIKMTESGDRGSFKNKELIVTEEINVTCIDMLSESKTNIKTEANEN